MEWRLWRRGFSHIHVVWFLLVAVLTVVLMEASVEGGVTYDGRALIIDGRRRMLFSGDIHYPRSTPQMWPSLISKAKEGGLDVIQTYVFWNMHEPNPGQYNFEGRYDLVAFLKQVQGQGLYVSLRIGPYIESEWNYGGLPFWLRDVPGIQFRTNNEPFKFYMQNFTTKIVQLMQSNNMFASQGGPIIISQIENEYGTYERGYHEGGVAYVKWAAQMAVGLNTAVPWMMCKQDDAPNPVINTCNGLICGETFSGPNSPNKPALWTENWTTQFQVFGGDPRIRHEQEIAYAVALFLARKNGSFVNYYMYHGGTNFGRTSSAYVTTSYYDDAPLDEYGLEREPKWGHLKELHAAVKRYATPLLYGKKSTYSLGEFQEALVFQGETVGCVAFLVNTNQRQSATVNFQNTTYHLPRHSISIGDCKREIFNTAKVTEQYATRSYVSSGFVPEDNWKETQEPVPIYGGTRRRARYLLEQLDTTKDASDYLWYTTSLVNIYGSTTYPLLHIESTTHVVYVFINGEYVGTAHGAFRSGPLLFEKAIPLKPGLNQISILSAMVGTPNAGGHLEKKTAGIQTIRINGSNNSSHDLSSFHWGYQVGLSGGRVQRKNQNEASTVEWTSFNTKHQPLMWYKTTMATPQGDAPVALNLSSMGKGVAWVNGYNIGRYWVSFLTPTGKPSQEMYHVPRSFLKPTDNEVILFEEIGGDPSRVSFVTVSVSQISAHVSDSHPPPTIISSNPVNNTLPNNHNVIMYPQVRLRCTQGKTISSIQFASFGTPRTTVQGTHSIGRCHALNSKSVVEKICLGRQSCSIEVSKEAFGDDPCPRISKSLMVDAICS